MNSITLKSPAKLNLALKVVNKRPDGYHNLKTLFERIDLCDEISFVSNQSGKIRIQCNDPQVPTGPKNLIYRVCRLLQDEYGTEKGVSIKLKKRIPVAAGLGGGSSNAATALLGLNKIWKIGLNKAKLVQIGQRIGSDVPFFLHDCSWGMGLDRGDSVKKLPINAKLWHILIIPRVKMYSSEVFTTFKLQLTNRSDNVNILIRSLKDYNINRVENLLFNDLEESILGIRPSLINIKNRLKKLQITGVLFSGSGPSVFGLVESKKKAEEVKAILGKRYSRIFVVSTL